MKHDFELAELLMLGATTEVRPLLVGSGGNRLLPSGSSPEVAPNIHSAGCLCRRCLGLWEALIAAHPDGTPFFTDEELESMSHLPVEAWG